MRIETVHHSFTRPPTKRRSTDTIVIHHQAGNPVPAATIHQWHQRDRGWIGIGYNYVIQPDGRIETGRPEDTVGAHAGPGVNGRSIGICITGNLEKHPPDERQIRSLVWLIKDIEKRYGKLKITGHKEHMATSCPGQYFPMERVKQMIQEGHKLTINGREVAVPIRNNHGRIEMRVGAAWIQARELAESLGGSITWDQAAQTARMTIR